MNKWKCKICGKYQAKDIADITRHIFLNHTSEAIGLLPIKCFEMIGQLFLNEFLDLWKTIIKKIK